MSRQVTSQRPQMNRDISNSSLPSLTVDILTNPDNKIDNLFSTMCQKLGFKTLLERAGFKKRSGSSAQELVYLLMIWVWLKVDSVSMFSKSSLQGFSTAKKDALYDLLNREDLNWRKLQLITAKKVLRTTDNDNEAAFVVDDSVKIRRGKTMPGVSSHFDHLTARCVMGQQILTLGIATQKQFVPLDNEIFISKTKIQPLNRPFKDARSIVAKRYNEALEQTKPEMVRNMISRALRADITAKYFLADAWFATKQILKMTEDKDLTAIVRMKKNKMKYRLIQPSENQDEKKECSAQELYQSHIKGQWQSIKDRPYQSKSIIVELNLAQSKKEDDRWIKVKLLFVRGVNEEKEQASKNDWALFLSTDATLTDDKILAVYALRWGIEVYFKEAKQKLGFLKEQSTHYSTYIASIHLTGLRFCLLLYAKYEEGAARLCDVRKDIVDNLCELDFAHRLWGLFRGLITLALNENNELSEESKENTLRHIDHTVELFFKQVMQMDSYTLQLEAIPDDVEP